MHKSIVLMILSLILIMGYQNCSPYHQGGNGSSINGSEGGEPTVPSGNPLNGDTVSGAAFAQTLYPILDTNCASCHGVGQVPLYMSDDSQISHDLVIINNLVDLSNPSGSFIVPHIQQGHQNVPVTVADEILQAIIDWGNQIP